MNESQRQYELTLILIPDLDEKGVDSLEKEVEESIKNLGGTLKKKDKPERRNLSYPIKKFQTGYYLGMSFLFSPEKLQELVEFFKHKKDILRYMINFLDEASIKRIASSKKSRPRIIKSEQISQSQQESGAVEPKAKKIDRFKEITKEITEEEIQEIKKASKKKEEKKEKTKTKETKEIKMEEIDQKLDEILGI